MSRFHPASALIRTFLESLQHYCFDVADGECAYRCSRPSASDRLRSFKMVEARREDENYLRNAQLYWFEGVTCQSLFSPLHFLFLYLLAPEVLNMKPYGHSADWWSLGIIMYALLLGQVCIKSLLFHWIDQQLVIPSYSPVIVSGQANKQPFWDVQTSRVSFLSNTCRARAWSARCRVHRTSTPHQSYEEIFTLTSSPCIQSCCC